eukprot:s736_g8.t1
MPRAKDKSKDAPWRPQAWDGYRQKDQSAQGWSGWPGTWRSAGSSEPGANKKAFPSYDRSWGPEPAIQVVKEARAVVPLGVEDFTARNVQQAVNALRRAEGRVARIAKDQKEKAARFAAYERQMMAAYNAELQKHDAHQERLATESLEAAQQLEQAKNALAKTIAGHPIIEEMGSREPELAWHQLLQKHKKDAPTIAPEDLELLRQYKAGVLRGPPPGLPQQPPLVALQGSIPTFGPPAETAENHPTANSGSGTDAQRAVPANLGRPTVEPKETSYGAISPSGAQARAAPYPPGSPVLLPPEEHGRDIREAATPAPDPHAPPRMPVRESVKDATRTPPPRSPTGGMGLQAKLELKREAERGAALHPFRRQPSPPQREPPELGPAHLGTEAAAAAASAIAQATLVEDDADLQDGTRSPGLTNLE